MPVDSSRIRTVFCAFDFSETSKLALGQSERFARRHRARLVLAHVVEPIPPGPYPVWMAPSDDLAIREIAADRIEKLAESLRVDDLVVESRVEMGHPGSQLIEIADSMDASVFLIGTRGLSGFQHLMLGSTAEYVVRRSSCPVFTLHPSDHVLRGSIETVVLPTDLSLDADKAAQAFISLFGEWERPRILLVFADRTPPYLEPFQHKTLLRFHQRDVVKEEIERKMAPVVSVLQSADFEVETLVLDGEPISVTTDLARDREADMIVMGTHGRSAVANLMTGRTAQRIVQHAPCPVLTVRCS